MDSTTLQPTEQAIPLLTEQQARRLCEKIVRAVHNLGELLWEFHERKGWLTLGYASWSECCENEFKYSKRYANYLIQSHKIHEQVGTIVPTLPESQARELAKLPENIRLRVLELAQEDAGDKPVTAEIIRNSAKGLLNRCPSLTEKADGQDGVAAGESEQGVGGGGENVEDVAAGDDVRAEDVDDRAEPNKPPRKGSDGRPRGGVLATEAMQFATIAISQLERIRDNDPRRENAFNKVQVWIYGSRGVCDLEPLVRSWMERTGKSPEVAANILESVASKLRAEQAGDKKTPSVECDKQTAEGVLPIPGCSQSTGNAEESQANHGGGGDE